MRRSDLIIRLAVLAHQYGLPAYELDNLIHQTATALGMTVHVVALPTYLDITIEATPAGDQTRHFVRLEEESYDLEKLSKTLQVKNDVVRAATTVDEAGERLDAIEALPDPYPWPVVGLAYAACGAGFAVVLSGAPLDVAFAAGLSIVIFLLIRASARWPWLERRIHVVSALVAASLSGVAGAIVGTSNTWLVALCAFVVLVPGLGLTLGAFELVAGHTVLGWHRFIRASVRTFALFAGAAIGGGVVAAVLGTPDLPSAGVSDGFVRTLFVLLLMIGLVVVFQVVPRQAPWSIVAGILAYGGLELGGRAGPWQGPFLGALAIGLFALAYGRLGRRSTSLVVVLPGILILVPGVAAYASLRSLDPTQGGAPVASSSGVLLQIAAILAGLFAAASIAEFRPPTRRPTPSNTEAEEPNDE